MFRQNSVNRNKTAYIVNLSCGAILLHIVCIIIIYSVLTQNPFCRDLRCFDAKLILSRFTHFCVEQKLTHNDEGSDMILG